MYRRPLKPSAAHQAAQDTKIARLKAEIAEMQKRIEGRGDPEALVKEHIKLLHTYNEIKDGAQSLIGRYAIMTNTTVREIHEEMGLSLTE